MSLAAAAVKRPEKTVAAFAADLLALAQHTKSTARTVVRFSDGTALEASCDPGGYAEVVMIDDEGRPEGPPNSFDPY